MTVHDGVTWITLSQLFVGGLAAMLAAEQAAVWRWEGRHSSARRVAATAAACAGLLVSNAVLLLVGDDFARGWLYLVRAVMVAAVALSLLPLADVLTDHRPPRLLTYAIVGLVVARLLLQFCTRLIFAHKFSAGVPVYGPLSNPSGAVLIAAIFGYLLLVAAHGRTDRERVVLSFAILSSLAIATLSYTTADPTLGELLTGYVTLPSLAGMVALIWLRQNHAQRQVSRFAQRQHALAHLSWIALRDPLPDLTLAARQAAITYLPATGVDAALAAIEQPGSTGSATVRNGGDADAEFVQSLTNVLAAAHAREAHGAELEHRANHDELTGLPNRRHLRSLIDQALSRADDQGGVAVALCNLDRFGTVNDAYGYHSGDQILQLVAERLQQSAASCDQVGGSAMMSSSSSARTPPARTASKRSATAFTACSSAPSSPKTCRSLSRPAWAWSSLPAMTSMSTPTVFCATPQLPRTTPKLAARPPVASTVSCVRQWSTAPTLNSD